MRRVVVTGMGLLTSIGDDKETSWTNLISKKSGIKKIDQFDVSNLFDFGFRFDLSIIT